MKPGVMGILAAIEDAISRGERRLDLGGGTQPYKLRFADADDLLEWGVLAPLKARYPLTRLQVMRQQSRFRARQLFHKLPADQRARVKAVARRR